METIEKDWKSIVAAMTLDERRARKVEIHQRAKAGDFESWEYSESIWLEEMIPEEKAAREKAEERRYKRAKTRAIRNST